MASGPLAGGVILLLLAHLDVLDPLPFAPLVRDYAAMLPRMLYLVLGSALLALGSIILFMFRDPRRGIGKGIVSPADGVVRFVHYIRGGVHISIFLGLHNVHVVRAPIYGSVKRIVRHRGPHRPAFLEGSSSNERISVHMNTPGGEVRVIMIAGAFARRIVPYIRRGDILKKGEKIGFIRFGSRVDIILPTSFEPNVMQGSRVRAATDTIAVESRTPGKEGNFGDAWVIPRRR